MLKSLRLISGLALIVSSLGTLFAGEMPYSDVPATAPYASAVQELYDGRVISDDGSHLFRPDDLIARDFFVSLAVGIGCKECMTPSVDDIIHYSISPFVDLPKANPYYYCIAYAKEYSIAQGYILNEVGQSSCENSVSYTSSPFCPNNTISRIEAAAILLRRAKLWDDGLNAGNFDRSVSIPDVTPYWYGYARKGIEIGIISAGAGGTIGQDSKITRGEFAIMAARILRYTQCQTIRTNYTIPSEILIRDPSGGRIDQTVFPRGYSGSLIVETGSGIGSYDKRWTLKNPVTGEVLTGSGESYPISGLGCGTWISTVDVIDRVTRRVASTASSTITIACQEQRDNSPLSVTISADPLSAPIGIPIGYDTTVSGGSGTVSYRWDYGDGTTSTTSGATSHIYRDNGAYTVTLTVTDASGRTAISSVVVVITGERDTDGDGIVDRLDQCPLVYAQTTTGCPAITTYRDSYDRGGANTGGVLGGGTRESSYQGNICLIQKSKTQGLLIGSANCTQCPCNNSIDINSSLRSCDVLFPTILSPVLDSIYSRGGFFLIP